MDGVELIAAERQRQIQVEGFSAKHDDEYKDGELTLAAMVYADESTPGLPVPLVGSVWPWDERWFKPSDPIRNLVKAGALIAAEIDRLQRAIPPPVEKPKGSCFENIPGCECRIIHERARNKEDK